MKQKNGTIQISKVKFILILVVFTLWVATLTYFTAVVSVLHDAQAKEDSESIFQLSVENAKQQLEINELKKRQD